MEITVTKAGKEPLPITQVPRLEKDDVLKVRLLEEPVNSLKPDQSNFDWTFIIAFVNPGRSNDSDKTVSEEINFRKKGWYKEHSFVVPYDSQPIFFLYPKPQYRAKILNLITKNQEVIQKIGEKTIEIADAYAKIGTFLNELQDVVNRNYYRGLYSNYNYGNYGGVYGNNARNFGYNDSFLAEQAIERIARSFNIQMPSCWTGNQFNPYGNYNNNQYNNGYNNQYNNSYYNNYGGNGSNDLVGRVQCLTRTVRVEDFDISVSKMLQQGGIFAAAQLTQKYPQIAFWINIAAAALDFIIKLTNRAPLKIIPTVVAANESPTNTYLQNGSSPTKVLSNSRISLFAENPPSDRGFVTAYPMVFHKWQADADPGVINMPMPVLANSCLHAGQNIIRTTDVLNDWIKDNFAKDFQLTLTSNSGFKKEFSLRKNVGFGGWELAISKDNLAEIATANAPIEGIITGKRGFNKIQSAVFNVPLSSTANWIVTSDSQKSFTVGGKRTVTLQNQNGDCRCLETVVYKSEQGQETLFDTKKLSYTSDGKEVSFEIDTTELSSGKGQLELRQYGGELNSLNLNIYPVLPNVTDVKVSKGDSQVKLIGERLEQIQAVRVNGKRATANVAIMNPVDREKTFVFENAMQWQDSNSFSLEIELSEQRIIKVSTQFGVSAARPVFAANNSKEIEGFLISKSVNEVKNNLPVFSTDTEKIGVNIQNSLTDYDFKIENLTIETRIENTEVNPFQENDISYEVLDWRSMRLSIRLSEQSKKFLGGRRIQFRILDNKRGNSDWYSIKQTFVRMPQITSLKCSTKECEIIGRGISYIQQISLDDGKTWFSNESTGLVAKAIENDLEKVVVQNVSESKKVIKIKLRDFPNGEAIPISLTNR
ncbi:MAG: hypothetical protein HC846_01665 [Blastocatellia bacterium]|nr:hypothetical protein [Blastocatellia bacterium]